MKKIDPTYPQGARPPELPPLIELRGVSKVFGGTVAVSDVTLDVRPAEVLALLGENGAGKSTCVKMMCGVHKPTAGDIIVAGKVQNWHSPLDAQHAGIAVVHQHPGLFPDLSIVENIYFGRYPTNAVGLLDRKAMHRRVVELLDMVGLAASPDALLKSLSISEQQLVEIAKALSTDADVLILDEPTASLSHREVEKLFAVVRKLKARGVGIVFVGHRMDEVFHISDRISVLRDGALVRTADASELSRQQAINLMAGRELQASFPQRKHDLGPEILSVENLGVDAEFEDISLSVRAGEIMGIGGLVGSGRTEFATTIFGVKHPSRGSIRIDGKTVDIRSPQQAMKHGIAYVSEDRHAKSLIMDFPIRVNASLTVLQNCTHHGLLRPAREVNYVKEYLQRLKLRFASYEQEISGLSGGNQQKVVLSKWLATKPRILILDEPTQGIDVESKAEVHAIIADLARSGMAIVLISSELPELIGMCDRITVLREGRQTATFEDKNVDPTEVLKAATETTAKAEFKPADHDAASGPDESGAESKAKSVLRQSFEQVFMRREIGLVVAILAVVIPVSIINPRMLSFTNLQSLSMDAGLLGFVALGEMLVILTRNIDLSVASVIGLTAYAAALLMSTHPELPALAGLGFAVLIGGGLGTINGLIVGYGRVPSIVATLGTMSVYRGLLSLWANGDQISADEVPQHWLDLAGQRLLGLPGIVVASLVTLAIAGFLLQRTRFGREIYGVGSNPEAADTIGVPSARRILAAFAIAGALAGVMGALWASRYATVDARVAFGYELTVIASVVVGGVAIRGGSGTVLGIILGVVTLLVIRNGLSLVRVNPLWLQGVYGLVILAAITIDAKIAARSERALKRRMM
ncbi:ATP-binding cassette domain-containing protein [Martelella lutilitoris]|uniref:ATP-binding cassette domain-containing protein n=1 Tax=Martelella lutilitoris TaxID=2583532 RepID=A0A5C4JWG2_9HYPH|nr:ATP-binding cassette domain-containing protein [Martelella lutilitoris]TNB49570.1 ATP-binding cassette domain-containing protein [Martelella lutilitoris]